MKLYLSKNFSITEEQYLQESGLQFPQQPYLQNNSALAKMAKIYGYEIKVRNILVVCEKKGEQKWIRKNFLLL